MLFGVFFAMGYIVGRNSPRIGARSPRTAATPAAAGTSAADARPQPLAAGRVRRPPPRRTRSRRRRGRTPQPTRSRARLAAATAPAAAPPSRAAAAPPPAARRPPRPAAGQLLAGDAPSKPDVADAIAQTLQGQRLSSVAQSRPQRNLTRVLVGPYHRHRRPWASAKTDLEDAGFHPVASTRP